MYTLDSVRLFRQTVGKKQLLLDTNLLLLLLVGACDKTFLPKFNCTSKYTEDDYNLLISIFNFFETKIVITPHILAEFSDISIRDIKAPKIHYYFATVLNRLKNYREEHIPLERFFGMQVSILAIYGFPDMSIIEASKKLDAVILTDDIGLGEYANSCRIANIKFGAVKADRLLKAK